MEGLGSSRSFDVGNKVDQRVDDVIYTRLAAGKRILRIEEFIIT
jgi:hypothetical protein